MGEPLSILFVCTANIARSPYAEHRARRLVQGDRGWRSSAQGPLHQRRVPGTRWRAMDDAVLRELKQRGFAASGHRSRPVDLELIEEADLALAVEFAQRIRLLDSWPAAASRLSAYDSGRGVHRGCTRGTIFSSRGSRNTPSSTAWRWTWGILASAVAAPRGWPPTDRRGAGRPATGDPGASAAPRRPRSAAGDRTARSGSVDSTGSTDGVQTRACGRA